MILDDLPVQIPARGTKARGMGIEPGAMSSSQAETMSADL